MQLTFLGAAQEVGRSCFLLEGKRNVLLDCGVKLKSSEEFPLLEDRQIKKLEDVVISHAHLDHSGYAPALYASGYSGKVTMTKPTRDLIQLLLADYLRINPSKAYNDADLLTLLKNTNILEYKEAHGNLKLFDAGHILGSAMVELFDDKSLLYTGDVNLRSSRLLDGAKLESLQPEVLIMESTYGGHSDEHPASKDVANKLVESIQHTLDKDGKIVIPTFAIGRGQEVLFILENYMKSGKLERVPIYLDGMVKKALKIYRHNAIYLKDEIKRRILTSEDDPFKSPYYQVPERRDRSDVFEKEKAIIVTTSGMLNGGPVLSYLQVLAGNRKNKLILTGYQAEGTPGRSLLDGAKTLNIAEKLVEINMHVEQAKLSGHSDQKELLKIVRDLETVKKVFLVHGEKEKPHELKQAIEEMAKKEKREVKVIVPALGETYTA